MSGERPPPTLTLRVDRTPHPAELRPAIVRALAGGPVGGRAEDSVAAAVAAYVRALGEDRSAASRETSP